MVVFTTADPLSDGLPGTLQQTQMPTRRRLLVIRKPAPVLIDLELFADGQPLAVSWLAAAESIRQQADANNDNRVSWLEVIASDVFGQSERTAGDRRNRSMVAKAYDSNNNGIVEPTELIRFLNRNVGGQEFVTVVAPQDPADDSTGSVFSWLDRDGDRILSKTELLAVQQRLRQRDADGDGRIWLNDFRGQIPGMPNMAPAKSIKSRDVVVFDPSRYRFRSFVISPGAGVFLR